MIAQNAGNTAHFHMVSEPKNRINVNTEPPRKLKIIFQLSYAPVKWLIYWHLKHVWGIMKENILNSRDHDITFPDFTKASDTRRLRPP
jgi:hypothetical protein